MEFAKYLTKLRKEKGMTQTELAERMNVSNKTISKWETGNGFPETSLLVSLADIFEISVDQLLRGGNISKAGEENANSKDESHHEENIEEKDVDLKNKHLDFKAQSLNKHEAVVVAVAVPIMLIGICIMTILASVGLNYGIYLPILFTTLGVSIGMLSNMGMKKGFHVLGGEDSKDISKYIAFISTGVALLIFSPTMIVCMYPFGVHLAVYISLFSLVITLALGFMILGGINYGNIMAQLAVHKVVSASKDEETARLDIEKYYSHKSKKESISGAICGCLMISCTIAFLIAGLGFGIWHPTWVVFPVGGLLCGVVGIITDLKK